MLKGKKSFRRIMSMMLSITMVATMSLLVTPSISVSAATYIVVTDSSPQEWKDQATYTCTGGTVPTSVKTGIAGGGHTWRFAPGEYHFGNGTMTIGANTVIQGTSTITQPANKKDMLYPDSTTMAVFQNQTELPSTTQASSAQITYFQTISGATNVNIENIAFAGYTTLKLFTAIDSSVKNSIFHNYRGIYPDGQWCNMGYANATGTLWLCGDCNNVTVENCQLQCSSHHGLCLHGGDSYTVVDTKIKNTRALHCGCGQLKGDNSSNIAQSELRVPETNGHGYMDWSVAYDLNETINSAGTEVTDSFAYDGWKAGFYTEPEQTGGHIDDISLIRCVSIDAGQRALLTTEPSRITIVKETEGANFYFQGGYFEDCISVNAEKAGFLFGGERDEGANPGRGIIDMVRCGDRGSPVSIAAEMRLNNGNYVDDFWSVLPVRHAFEIHGDKRGDAYVPRPANIFYENSVIICSPTVTVPIKVCSMQRVQLIESRDPNNQAQTAVGGKYDTLEPVDIAPATLTGTVYNFPTGNFVYIRPCKYISGGTNYWNGSTDPVAAGSALVRSAATVNPDDFITVEGIRGTGPLTPVEFTDVPVGSWFKEAVDYMSAREIINGVGNNRFAPNGNVTRADFLIMIMRAYNIPLDEVITDNFADAGSKYYTPYLGTAKRLGLVNGIGNNKYAPTSNITRQDMFVILYRALDSLDELPLATGVKHLSDFTDSNKISTYAIPALTLFVESGVVSGSGGKLTPLATSRRSEAAQVLYNLLNT